MKAIGLDVGDKRIGLAKTDALNITAQGLGLVYMRVKTHKTYQEISDIMTREGADHLVVGLPKNLNGTIGPQADKVKDFVDGLKPYLREGVVIDYFDERLTTVSAQRVLIAGDVSRKKRKTVVDEMAATIILQAWLDRRKALAGEGPGAGKKSATME